MSNNEILSFLDESSREEALENAPAVIKAQKLRIKELETKEAKMTQINMDLKDNIYLNDIAMKKLKEEFAKYIDSYLGLTKKSGHFCPDRKNIIRNYFD